MAVRRHTLTVNVAGVPIGSGHPIAIQSMTNTPTLDIDASLAQTERLAHAGADLVRLTAQTEAHARAIGTLRDKLRQRGIATPLVADIHYNPRAAMTAVTCVDKVRINPGNYVDPGRTFKHLEYTDEEYAAELDRLRTAFVPLLNEARRHGTALRLGVNHGSLSDRIMSRYGDTPAGMVESVMEFVRIARAQHYPDIVISVKASNVTVMVETMRLLAATLDAEGIPLPLHLGVTEAGAGEDARIKSAVGIGTLLSEGIGDTIRVSLSEAPEHEIPVARTLVNYVEASRPDTPLRPYPGFDPLRPRRVARLVPEVLTDTPDAPFDPERHPDGTLDPERYTIYTISHPGDAHRVLQQLHDRILQGTPGDVAVVADYGDLPAEEVTIRAAVDLGLLLMSGFVDAIAIRSRSLTAAACVDLAYGILQACRLRITRTEYIACPGCGRTLFPLESTLAAVKEATQGLRGMKIAVMGCVVNGPGEMADADYGYVGAAAGKVSLYRGRECVVRNIPADEAVGRLIALMRSDGVQI